MSTYVRPEIVENDGNVGRKHNFYKITALGEQVVYTDFDFNLSVHPVTRDFVMRNNNKAIIQSLKNLTLTAFGEFTMENEIGGGASKLLFEVNDSLTSFNVRRRIEETIKNHENRIELKDVQVFKTPDLVGLMVIITFFYANNPEPVTEKFVLERLR